MQNAFGDGYALIRIKRYGAVFEVNEEFAFKDKEEFIIFSVLVLVKFALNNAEPDDAGINFG